MKRIIIFIALTGAMVLASCGTRQHCDAYGGVEYNSNYDDSTEVQS